MKKELNNLSKLAKKELKTLEGTVLELNLYHAGKNKNKKGGFNFYARDLILSSILLNDMSFLKRSLKLCILLQGKRNNSFNGEERGKIFHEYPEKKKTIKNNLNSGFNACDTTALFIIGFEYYLRRTKDLRFLEENKKSLYLSLDYILRHIKDGFFWEDPLFCGAKGFRLKSTYWKDTGFLGRKNNEPKYPVAYSIVQAQIICSLRAVSRMINNKPEKIYFKNLANKMNVKLWSVFWDKNSKNLSVGIDKEGLIKSNSSDYLHLLYYLKKGDVPKRKLKQLVKKSRELETYFGYRGALENKRVDTYFSAIWPWEQAFIFLAGKKHGLKKIQEVSLRCLRAIKKLNCFPEFIKYFNRNLEVLGYNTQLWTIAYVIFLNDFLSEKQ